MITVLQRQHVQKRAALPVRLKTHAAGLRWINGNAAARLRRAPPARTPVPWAPRHQQASRSARLGFLRARTVLAVLVLLPVIVVVLLVVSRSLLAGELLPQPKPLLPVPPETDQALYRMLIPEEPPRASSKGNPVLSGALKVASYRTQPGDSISQIAQRFGLNIDTVISWNDIRDARVIRPGTALDIPNIDGLKYRVRRGDSLEQIARSAGLPLNSVLDANRLPSSVISVGQELFLPGIHMRPNDLNRVLGNLFIYPVRGKISSFFGSRPDPFTGIKRFHNGVDIVNVPGTPIMAAMAGSVEDVGFNNNYGLYVILRHSGYQTLYGHLARYTVVRRQKVQQGEEIGELGTTGYSTGPHLHFSIFRNGEAVDPLAFLK
ncbi:MAG TPA: M23 family metallopeptidase [Spirochaetia bacterium]|nr:M23 family metallopeptidase [Spirochaetia bacterium]